MTTWAASSLDGRPFPTYSTQLTQPESARGCRYGVVPRPRLGRLSLKTPYQPLINAHPSALYSVSISHEDVFRLVAILDPIKDHRAIEDQGQMDMRLF